jgi:ubiquinone/menaquinone biosynthesis C-methylase UbiE
VKNQISLDEIEGLGYYDFMGYLGVPFFQIGGGHRLLKNSVISPENLAARVSGVDTSEKSIDKARKRAYEEGLQDLVDFHVGDAYNLSFESESFDVLITVFVS